MGRSHVKTISRRAHKQYGQYSTALTVTIYAVYHASEVTGSVAEEPREGSFDALALHICGMLLNEVHLRGLISGRCGLKESVQQVHNVFEAVPKNPAQTCQDVNPRPAKLFQRDESEGHYATSRLLHRLRPDQSKDYAYRLTLEQVKGYLNITKECLVESSFDVL